MTTLVVDQLQYQPLGNRYGKLVDNLRELTDVPNNTGSLGVLDKLKLKIRSAVDSLNSMQAEGCLADVSFVAKAGELTAVIGPDKHELKSIVELIGSGRSSGIFDGQVYAAGPPAKNSHVGASDIAYVAADAYMLYIPGLNYYQTVRYNALLRVKDPRVSAESVDKAVLEALELMGLSRYCNRVIPERPQSRGLLGGELRALRIAADIALMPSIIVLEDPLYALDYGVATDLMARLRSLVDLGRTIICTFQRPDNTVFDAADLVVLVVHGRTVFASNKGNLLPHFTSNEIGYVYNHEKASVIDFVMDIACGVERPAGQRLPPTAQELQISFEQSKYCDYKGVAVAGGVFIGKGGVNEGGAIPVLPLTRPKPYISLIVNNNMWANKSLLGRRVYVAFERAVVTKLREYAILQKSVVSNTLIGLLIGYFCYDQGDFGDYTMALFNFPYDKVTNIASQLFISNVFVFMTQVLNVHIISQKMKVFRNEQRGGVMSGFVFCLSTVMAEIPFAVFYASIFSAIVYFMVGYREGYENFQYFMTVQMLTAAMGVMFTLTLAAVFQKEFVVRDTFLMVAFVMVMFSGFPFSLGVMRDSAVDAIQYNPLKWSFEGLLHWQFIPYPDGANYLAAYSFQNFQHMNVYPIMANFFMAIGAMLLIATGPRPSFLRRRQVEEELTMARPVSMDNRFSTDSDLQLGLTSSLTEPLTMPDSYMDSRQDIRSPSGKKGKSLGTPRNSNLSSTDHAAPPVLFMRDAPSGAAPLSLSFRPSASLNIETDEHLNRGPTVTVHELSVAVLDPRSPLGHRNILSDVTVKLDWGKMCVIMGAKDSGKSSLLHILSGADNRPTTKISGSVLFDGRPTDPTARPWHRGGYVEALDDHFRDLTVLDIVMYAIRLRCLNLDDINEILPNVNKTLTLLRLHDVKHVNAKLLSRGDRRRLSIAEELVTGPNFMLLDEPVTNLNAKESALIMNAFRELVNQEKTVVATMHEPSAEVFSLCDHLVLLSKGSVEKAVSFFTEDSPLKLVVKGYSNPADFLADVSGCRLNNSDNDFCDTPALVSNWKSSQRCISEENNIPKSIIETSTNPLLDRQRTQRGDEVSNDGSSKERTYWSGTRSIDISTNRSERSISGGTPPVFKNLSVGLWLRLTANVKPKMTAYRIFTILEREMRAMINRPRMIFSSMLLQICIAGIYGIMMTPEDASTNAGAVTSYFGIGSVLIMLTIVPLGFYLHNNYKVFKKEHSRGLYSIFSYWLVGTIPFLTLRSLHFVVYTLLSHKLMGLQSGNVGQFYYLNMYCFQIAHSLLMMFFVYQAAEVRSVYYAVPGTSFVLFFFSGMIVKPSTLPSWAAPWMPSISLIRWFMQAGVINEGNDNPDLFKTIANFEIYKQYLGLFGWNGKTKYYCLYMTLINMAVYFLMCLIAHFLAIRAQTGRRQLRAPDDDDRLF